MTTYKNKKSNRKVNYRKIYELVFGPIPKDEFGRSFDIHHIDGDHTNNDISNLKAVSIQEHYDIHYARGDFGACWLITRKLKLSPSELTDLNKKQNQVRLLAGTHNLQGSNNPSHSRLSNGTHNFQIDHPSRRKVKLGIHHTIGTSHNQKMIAEGKHTSQNKVECPHCGKITSINNAKRWHLENCKSISQ
jgi:hypothetical protein